MWFGDTTYYVNNIMLTQYVVFSMQSKTIYCVLGLSMKKTLSKLLIDRGMTVTELAEKTGISYNTLMNIGKRDLSFSRMVKIADALDVSLDEFRKG